MTEYTPAQLEAWAGSGPWEWCENWLYVANYNEHPGPVLWYTANDDGVHAKPNDATLIAAAPDLARLVLERDKEIAELKAENSMLVNTLDKIATEADETWCEWTLDGPLPGDAVRFAASILDTARHAITMKETSDE